MDREGAVVAGLICLDIIPSLARGGDRAVLQPGHTMEVGPIAFYTGGAVANTGRALHRLGISTQLIARVGDDAVGDTLRALIGQEAAALAEGLIVAPGETSPCTVVLSASGSDRSFITHPGTNHTFGPEHVPDDALRAARLFHFGYPPYMRRMYDDEGHALADLLRRARQRGAVVSLDLAYPEPAGRSGQADWRRILARALPYVDLFLPSADELLFMLRREIALAEAIPVATVSALADECLEMGAGLVALKVGDRGLYVRSGEDAPGAPSEPGWLHRELWAPCFRPQTLIGTTGAGDTTIAGFLAAFLRGLTLEEAMTMAVAVGACCVEAPDALSGIRSWDETRARVRAGWPRSRWALDQTGWRWDEERALWIGPRDLAEPPERHP